MRMPPFAARMQAQTEFQGHLRAFASKPLSRRSRDSFARGPNIDSASSGSERQASAYESAPVTLARSCGLCSRVPSPIRSSRPSSRERLVLGCFRSFRLVGNANAATTQRLGRRGNDTTSPYSLILSLARNAKSQGSGDSSPWKYTMGEATGRLVSLRPCCTSYVDVRCRYTVTADRVR